MILLINNLREKKTSQKVKKEEILTARITTFAAVLHAKCTRFQIIGRTSFFHAHF